MLSQGFFFGSTKHFPIKESVFHPSANINEKKKSVVEKSYYTFAIHFIEENRLNRFCHL